MVKQHTLFGRHDGHTIVYDQGPTSWGAYVEDLPTCVAVAETFEEPQRLVHEGVAIYLEELRQDDESALSVDPSQ